LSALAILAISVAASPGQQTTQKPAHKKATGKAAAPAGPPVMAYGSKNAPITMEVFSDYQCPSCGNLYEQTLKPMINDYVAVGKVYLVHRDFPLSMHKYSGDAARWAKAAAVLGHFESVEAALYDNQNFWATDGDIAKYIAAAVSPADFKRIEALVKGCEGPAIQAKSDRSSPLPPDAHPCALDTYIADDIQLGYKIPVQATPTYVITYKGQALPPGSGPVSWQVLKQFFDSLLSQ